jgi:hypothetical protein
MRFGIQCLEARETLCSRRDRYCTTTTRAIVVERLKSFVLTDPTQSVCAPRQVKVRLDYIFSDVQSWRSGSSTSQKTTA